MKNTILRFGLYASLAILFLFSISSFLLDDLSYSIQEIYGYASMILATSFVYFGIRHYRDNVNNSTLTFMEGLKLGLLIVTIPSIVFGLFNVLYTEIINPEFLDNYYSQHIENMKATMSLEEFNVALESIEADKEMFRNPVINFLVMGVTEFMIGIIATVISTLMLKKK